MYRTHIKKARIRRDSEWLLPQAIEFLKHYLVSLSSSFCSCEREGGEAASCCANPFPQSLPWITGGVRGTAAKSGMFNSAITCEGVRKEGSRCSRVKAIPRLTAVARKRPMATAGQGELDGSAGTTGCSATTTLRIRM